MKNGREDRRRNNRGCYREGSLYIEFSPLVSGKKAPEFYKEVWRGLPARLREFERYPNAEGLDVGYTKRTGWR